MARSFREGNILLKHSIGTMYQATADDRGTVQALARELDAINEDGEYCNLPRMLSCYCHLTISK